MSDYVHEKVVRLPIPESLKEKHFGDIERIEDELSIILGELWCNSYTHTFKLGYTDENYYIDWCYYHTYGEESGDWGYARFLTKKELKVIKPYFNKLGFPYKDKDLRVVDYCYYNCCEPSDYYEVVTDKNDESALFSKKEK